MVEKDVKPENEAELQRQEISELEAKVEKLKKEVAKAEENMHTNLLKQIEVLAVFALVVSLTITDVIGIGALGNIGFMGLAKINLAYVVSTLILLLGVRFIVVGGRK